MDGRFLDKRLGLYAPFSVPLLCFAVITRGSQTHTRTHLT